MWAKRFYFLISIACQILFDESSAVIPENTEFGSIPSETPSTFQTPNLPEGYVSFPEDHAAYKFHTTPAFWGEARENCVAEGARLAITDTLDKLKRIKNLRKEPSWHWIHVGFNKSMDDGQWVRVDDGLPVTSLPWLPNYPRPEKNCAGISVFSDGLIDYPCDLSREHYACEILM